ncbi:MAG: long-chain fatty acid--CoA ligase [Gemmatimonadota bacterium]
MTFRELAGEVLEIFRRGVDEPVPDHKFNDLATRVFRFQCRANQAYSGFVARRGVSPDEVTRWEQIPFLPTRAFKAASLVSGDPEKVERVFRTSGTTLGREGRGEHHVVELALYRENLLPNFKAHLIPEGERLRVLCLLPPPDSAADSSLSFMMGEVVGAVGEEGSGFFMDPDGEIEGDRFRRSLRAAEGAGEPVLVVGTAFSFVGWMELAKEKGWRVDLPDGSRIMETGGYKGRSRELPRAELYRDLEISFGVQESHIVNEYGMTELLSQFYETVLAGTRDKDGHRKKASPIGLAERYHRGPPWVRTRVLNPLTLETLAPGDVGVLSHLDLANLGSVAAVLTEDLGREVPGGFRLLGRSPGSEPRGCSLAMEDFRASRAGER